MIMIRNMGLILVVFGLVAGGNALDWDYFVFAQLWPDTFCKYHQCVYPRDVIKGWNIHGLWPSSSKGKDPFNCKFAPPFNVDQLKPIFESLSREWADLKNFVSPQEFWKYEWKKHGSCSMDDPLLKTELAYFNQSLVTKRSILIDKIFSDNSFEPSNERKYNTQMISDAITRKIGVIPRLECVKIEDEWYLSAIYICLDKEFGFIECPHRKKFLPAGNVGRFLIKPMKLYSQPINTPCGDHEFILPSGKNYLNK